VTPEQERQAASLMRLAQGGDQAAYAALLVLLTSLVRQFARRRIGGAAVWVDDVVQETLLTVHSARHTYDPRRPFAPWFYAIASNRLIDVLRRERRIAAREIAGGELPDGSSHAGGMERDDIDVEAIRAAVAALPPRQRAIVEGLKFRDQSVREVADRMGMSESAVKVTAHRGYRALRRLLGAGTRED
jgi:RNA polymerase sigma-70 factor (ECF subfamily)